MATAEGDQDWASVLAFLEPRPPLFCPHAPTLRQKVFLRSEAMEVLFGGHAGGGKMCSMLHDVLTPFGFQKMADIKVGSQVIAFDGTIAEVIRVLDFKDEPLFRVSFSDGTSTVTGADHGWGVRFSGRRPLKANRLDLDGESLDYRIRTTAFLQKYLETEHAKKDAGSRTNWPLIPLCKPVNLTLGRGRGRGRVVDPYIVGLLLGDGTITTRTIVLTTIDDEIGAAFRAEVESRGGDVIFSEGKHWRSRSCPSLADDLEYVGVLGKRSLDKSIPRLYKMAPVADRWSMVQGLMDTDGTVDDRGHCSYTSISKELADDMTWMLRSLGFKVTITDRIPWYPDEVGERIYCNKAYTLYIQGPNTPNLFRLTRKKNRCSLLFNGGENEPWKRMVAIEPEGRGDARCITIDHPSGLFITDDFIVTHNSDALLMAALQYVDVPGYAAIIFRNTFSDLALPGSLMDRSHDWLDDVPDVRWNPNRHNWQFPSGATLTFGYLDKPNDHLRYKSAEFQFVGFDEVTEIREKHYRYLFSRIRRPSGRLGLHLAKVPLRMRAASNPAPNWVRRWFIEEGPKKGRIFVESSLSDNPFVDHVSYRKALAQLDEVERARLERGDWYAEESGSKFKRDWFSPTISSEDLPKIPGGIPSHFGGAFEKIVRYWDLAASVPTDRNPDPDWTAGALVGLAEGRLYVLDIVRFRADPGTVEKRVRETAELDGPEVAVRMEKEGGASGVNTIDHYGRFVLLGFDFDGHPTIKNKEGRADLWASKAKRKEVVLRSGGTWITDFLDELSGFPETSPHDDQVDAISGANEILTGLGLPVRYPVEIIV